MSGICGIVNFDGAPAKPEALEKMVRAAAHRGPDGTRSWCQANAALAHLALNLTPESVRERQPLVSEREGLVLTADARIDNREELARSLAAKGHLREREEPPTDAELILGAYRCWETGCAERLVGDFAFAVWDAKRGRLFAARDAMGMRGFYYRAESGRRVLFGTEAKQVLAVPGVPERIFEPAVGAYLAGCYGPLEWSFYEGISQLAPAHALVVDGSGHRVWRYWEVDPERRIEYAGEEEYVEHFLEVFLEAVRCRLRSTRPIGVLLSGGVDSGSIASMAGWLFRRNGSVDHPMLRAYSYAFEELPQCDERHISEGIVRHYGFPVTEVPADEAWPLKDYPAHGPDKDEPFIGAYQALYESALETARTEGMGLVLSGDRGDLMVGDAVVDHLGLLRSGQLRTLWDEMKEHGHRRNTSLSRIAMSQLLRPFMLTLWPQGAEWALSMRRKLLGLESPSYPEWVRPAFAEQVGLAEIVKEDEPRSTISYFARRVRYKLVFMYLHMRGVIWSERTQARFGLGFADPWSDRRLAEFVLAAPQWRLQQVREPKRIARQAMRGVMPEKVRREVGKIYPSPLYERAIKEQAKGTILNLLTDSQAAARGYVDEDLLRNYYESFTRGGPGRSCFWEALTLEMWLRQYWT